MSNDLEVEEIDQAGDDEVTSLEEGKILDYITGDPIKDSAKEQVRQRIARALFHEYGISVEDMARDFKMTVDGRRKKGADIAIFKPGTEHVPENLRRIVICEKEPKQGKKGARKMRDHDQAQKEFALLHAAMTEVEGCKYGLWTNGLEFFFFEKDISRFDVRFKPLGDWPLADESVGTRDVVSNAQLRRADPEMLRTAFRRCHNFIHGNEGMPKDAAFWQFLYLIFAKMHDEKRGRDEAPRFWAGPTEQFDDAGRKAIRQRIIPLFDDVKAEYSSIFRGNEEITLSDRALAFMVSELAKYDFGRTEVDAKGAAYQEIVGTNLRGDRGQYFTPRGAIKLMVDMLDPQPDEVVLDPACGTGGFLVSVLDHINRIFHEQANVEIGEESTDEFLSIRERLEKWADTHIFGADFDPFLVRAAQMNLVMASNSEGGIFNMNSLEFPRGHLPGVEEATTAVPFGSVDVVMTNPPFGSDIPVTDPNILSAFELAHVWEPAGEAFRNTGKLQSSVAPEVLFIERCVKWLKPGGRMGIVLPNGILGNPGDEYIRWWLLRHAKLLASVELPVEVFVAEADVNILTSLLFLRRKTEEEFRAADLAGGEDYPVFMAVAERVGFDRRGNTIYRRAPTGEELVEEVCEVERIRLGDRVVERTLRRLQKQVDDDLPAIATAYRRFRQESA